LAGKLVDGRPAPTMTAERERGLPTATGQPWDKPEHDNESEAWRPEYARCDARSFEPDLDYGDT
jgi:hypothetical protein